MNFIFAAFVERPFYALEADHVPAKVALKRRARECKTIRHPECKKRRDFKVEAKA